MRDTNAPPRVPVAWLGLALAAAALLVQAPLITRTVVPMDEGHLAAAASWMHVGKHLYRDIHTGIFPGIYLVTWTLFGVFGESLLVTRIAAALVNVATALALWRVTARATGERWGWLAPLAYLAFVPLAFPVLSMFNYSTLAVACGLGALLFLLRTLESRRAPDAVALGLCIAAAALTKQNFGGLVFVACGLGLLAEGRRAGFTRADWRRLPACVALAGLVPTVAVITGFLLTGTFGDLVESTILSLGGSQVQHFNNPIPPLLGAHPGDDGRFVFLYTPPPMFDDLLQNASTLGVRPTPGVRSAAIRLSYGVPLLVVAAACVLLVRLWRRGNGGAGDGGGGGDSASGSGSDSGSGARDRATRGVLLYAVIFFPGIFPSAIWSHLAFVMIPLIPVYVILAERLQRLLGRGSADGLAVGRVRRLAVPVMAGVVLTVWGAAGVEAAVKAVRRNPVPLGLARAPMKVSARMAGLLGGSVPWLEACAAPGEPVFVAPDIPLVYFLAHRTTPQPHDLTIPGNVDGALIARRLEEAGVRCAVYNPQMYPEFPPFGEQFPQLAGYLDRRFVRVATFEGGGSQWYGLVRRPVSPATCGGPRGARTRR